MATGGGGDAVRVAIADDHKLVREGIRWMLASETSIELVGEASDGAELVALIDRVETDVVLLDMRMPGVSGLDVLTELNARDDAPRVLVLSMYHDPALIQQAIALGAAGFINKGAGRAELIEAINTVAEGRNYLTGSLAMSVVAHLDDQDVARWQPLGDTETRILSLAAEGIGNREIAARLETSEADVRAHLKRIFSRLGVHSRSEAVAMALRMGAID
jgi:DNA-binding NarL/FixJ family response regulator